MPVPTPSFEARCALAAQDDGNGLSVKVRFDRGYNSDSIERHELEKIFVEGDEAFVTYKCMARGGKSFRNTEFFAFAGDKICRIDAYFGATYHDGVFVKQQQ
jgi:hypothetical protein